MVYQYHKWSAQLKKNHRHKEGTDIRKRNIPNGLRFRDSKKELHLKDI